MKVPRRLVGQYVEVEWLDPVQHTVRVSEILKGRAQLGVWLERGVLIDITEGVLIIEHSHCRMSDDENIHATWVPEELVVRICAFREIADSGEADVVPRAETKNV